MIDFQNFGRKMVFPIHIMYFSGYAFVTVLGYILVLSYHRKAVFQSDVPVIVI